MKKTTRMRKRCAWMVAVLLIGVLSMNVYAEEAAIPENVDSNRQQFKEWSAAIFKNSYPITVNRGTASPARAEQGTTVRITADCLGVGVRFKEWRVDSGNVTLENKNAVSTTFTMPNSAVELTAIYEPVVPPSLYWVAIKNGTANPMRAEAGTIITITADNAPTGYRFRKWELSPAVTFAEGTNRYGSTAKFVMPMGNVTCYAVFQKITPPAESYNIGELKKDADLFQEKTTDNPKKAWTIRMNMNLAVLYPESICLMDGNGKVLKATVTFDPKKPNQFVVSPENPYVSGEYYLLIQKEGLESDTGSQLRKNVLFRFVFRK